MTIPFSSLDPIEVWQGLEGGGEGEGVHRKPWPMCVRRVGYALLSKPLISVLYAHDT